MDSKGILLIGGGALLLYLWSKNQQPGVAVQAAGAGTAPSPGTTAAGVQTGSTGATAPTTTTYAPAPAATSAPAAVLNTTGLKVHPDVNNSLTGTVSINGQPMTLAVIQTDGRVFNSNGQDITQSLSAMGIDVNALRAAFATAPLDTTGVSGIGHNPYWRSSGLAGRRLSPYGGWRN